MYVSLDQFNKVSYVIVRQNLSKNFELEKFVDFHKVVR